MLQIQDTLRIKPSHILLALVSLTLLLQVALTKEQSLSEIKLKEDKFLKFVLEETPDYDMYVMTIQWGKTFCISQATCDRLGRVESNTLTIHGLWPSLKNKQRISVCHTGDKIHVKDDGSNIFNDLRKDWVTLKDSDHDDDFWTYEYNKHGYCYSYKYNQASPIPYFQKALDLYSSFSLARLIKDTLNVLPGQTVGYKPDELTSKFAARLGGDFFDLHCFFHDHKQYLLEIRLYLDLSFQRMVGFQESQNCHRDQDILIEYW